MRSPSHYDSSSSFLKQELPATGSAFAPPAAAGASAAVAAVGICLRRHSKLSGLSLQGPAPASKLETQ